MKKWSALTSVLLLLLIACAAWISLSLSGGPVKAPLLPYQWLAVATLLLGLCVVAGILINGRIDGILIDDRNRISLARLQWVAWLVILLSGYYTGAVLNAATGAADLPVMQAELFGLLGIVSGSAVVSGLIVDNKKSAPGSAPPAPLQPGQSGQIGSMDRNATAEEASWADLYCGDEVANRDVVDISRLQKLMMTTLLLMTYAQMLWAAFGKAAVSGQFAAMPAVGSTFLGLLGGSNAAYLAFKATPKMPVAADQGAAADRSGAPPPPPPPSPTAPPALPRAPVAVARARS